MSDEELCEIVTPLLTAMIKRRMLVGALRQFEHGEWIVTTVLDVLVHGGVLELRLEDDAQAIATATFL